MQGKIIHFNTHGNEKQKQVARLWCDQTTEQIVYGGSKGSGKSYLLVSMIFGDAFIYPETMYFIARKKLNDLRKYTIPSIHEVFAHWGITQSMYNFNGQDNYFELYNGSRVMLLQAKYEPSDPTYARFGSMQMTKGAIEEAGEFELDAKNNLMASIGRWKNKEYGIKGKMLMSCNPAKNFLYSDFYMPNKKGTLADHLKFVQAYPQDNKMLPKEYFEQLERTLTREQKERLLYGNWEYDDDPHALVDFDSLNDMFTNSHVKKGKRYISVDVARLGKDKTVIMVWDGFRVIKLTTIHQSTLDYVAQVIRELKESYQVPTSQIIVDADGLGAGLVDMIKCKEFKANARPEGSDTFTNFKSQCGFKLADMIKAKEIYFDCEVGGLRDLIVNELEQLKSIHVDSDMKQGLVSKDVMKERLGRSPDYLDCMIMRMSFELKKKIGFGAMVFD